MNWREWKYFILGRAYSKDKGLLASECIVPAILQHPSYLAKKKKKEGAKNVYLIFIKEPQIFIIFKLWAR